MDKKKAILRMTNGMFVELIDTAAEIDRVVTESLISHDRGWHYFAKQDVWVNRGHINLIEVKSGN